MEKRGEGRTFIFARLSRDASKPFLLNIKQFPLDVLAGQDTPASKPVNWNEAASNVKRMGELEMNPWEVPRSCFMGVG